MARFTEQRNYGGLVTRTVPTAETGFLSVLHEKQKPPLSSTMQAQHDLVLDRFREWLRSQVPSGIVEKRLAAEHLPLFVPTRNDLFPSISDKPDEFLIQGFSAAVNGYLLDVRGSRVNGGSLFAADWNSLQLNPAPASGHRLDLVFLEVWPAIITYGTAANVPNTNEIYPLGNRQWGDAYAPNNLIDTSFNPSRPTDGRIQLQYQFRLVDGVSRALNPDVMLLPTVLAKGNNGVLTSYAFTRQTAKLDAGLYVAGDGSATARAQLGSVTGYVYAIPICLVSRRNQEPYDITTNPNGAAQSVAGATPSDRDDGLFHDEIVLSDIEDLRHSVVNLPDLNRLVAMETDKLLRDQRSDLRASPAGNQQSAHLVVADAISASDLPGIVEVAEPDGVRTSFIINPLPQIAVDTVVPNTQELNGQVQMRHVGNTRLVEIEVPAPNTLGTVTLKWRNSGQAVALTGTSQPSARQWIGTLDTAHGQYQPAGTIDVIYEIEYADGVVFSHAVDTLLRVYKIDNLSQETDLAHVEDTAAGGYREALTDQTVAGYDNFFRDFDYTEAGYQSANLLAGYARLYSWHQAGNGGNTYIIPAQVGGLDVVGVFRLEEVSGPSAVHVVPASVTRNGNGTHTVVTPSGFAVDKVLRWQLILSTEAVVWSQDKRGIAQTATIEELSFAGNGVDTVVVVQAAARIISLPAFLDATLTRVPYVLRGGQRISSGVSFEVINERSLKVTLPTVTTDTVVIPVLTEWPVPADESLVVVYGYRPYAGASALPASPFTAADVFEVLAVGQSFLHSYGAGASGFAAGWLRGLAGKLPLADSTVEAFTGTEFTVAGLPAQTRFAYVPAGYVLTDEDSRRLDVGARFTLEVVAGAVAQGMAGTRLLPTDGGQFEIARPDFAFAGGDGLLQLVCPYLVRQQHTGEVYLLVVTREVASVADPLTFEPAAGNGVSFDFYAVTDRWLARG